MTLSEHHINGRDAHAAAELYESLPPKQPNIVTRSAHGVLIDDQDGDAVALYGNKTWHLRRDSADSDNLYFQCNDFDCEPLCGYPTTPRRRADTLAAVEGDITDLMPAVSRRLDSVPPRHTGHDREETPVRAQLWGPEETTLTPSAVASIRSFERSRRGSGRLISRADGARLTRSRHHIRTNTGGTHGRKAKVC